MKHCVRLQRDGCCRAVAMSVMVAQPSHHCAPCRPHGTHRLGLSLCLLLHRPCCCRCLPHASSGLSSGKCSFSHPTFICKLCRRPGQPDDCIGCRGGYFFSLPSQNQKFNIDDRFDGVSSTHCRELMHSEDSRTAIYCDKLIVRAVVGRLSQSHRRTPGSLCLV